jgi:hypothetical protein
MLRGRVTLRLHRPVRGQLRPLSDQRRRQLHVRVQGGRERGGGFRQPARLRRDRAAEPVGCGPRRGRAAAPHSNSRISNVLAFPARVTVRMHSKGPQPEGDSARPGQRRKGTRSGAPQAATSAAARATRRRPTSRARALGTRATRWSRSATSSAWCAAAHSLERIAAC